MANLSVNYCGVNYRNPLVLASATPGWDGEAMRLAGNKLPIKTRFVTKEQLDAEVTARENGVGGEA